MGYDINYFKKVGFDSWQSEIYPAFTNLFGLVIGAVPLALKGNWKDSDLTRLTLLSRQVTVPGVTIEPVNDNFLTHQWWFPKPKYTFPDIVTLTLREDMNPRNALYLFWEYANATVNFLTMTSFSKKQEVIAPMWIYLLTAGISGDHGNLVPFAVIELVNAFCSKVGSLTRLGSSSSDLMTMEVSIRYDRARLFRIE